MILAGDIGGTKTHLVLFRASGPSNPVKEKKYHSRDYGSILEILHDFLKDQSAEVERICLGIAGPIQNGRCHATNLPWVIDSLEISKELSIPHVWLINDLEANAYGLKCLSKKEFYVLNEGIEAHGNAALISAGTGLGEAGLYWDGTMHRPFACEGGHCGFAPNNELEVELLAYLRDKYGHVSYERILSGMGVVNIYRFFVDTGKEKPSDEVEKASEADKAKVITEMGIKKHHPACQKTLEVFVSNYGSEAGNLALKMLALGGVYIGGGIAPKILDVLKGERFFKAFIEKGRFADLLKSVPVKVVLNEDTALLGAARYAQEKG